MKVNLGLNSNETSGMLIKCLKHTFNFLKLGQSEPQVVGSVRGACRKHPHLFPVQSRWPNFSFAVFVIVLVENENYPTSQKN